jgi:hypothetical protein
MKNVCGWITPNRKFIECNSYSHIKVIKENEDLLKFIGEELFEWEDSLADTVQECERLESIGEHPEWHVAESEEYLISTKIRKKLKEKGCLRVGSSCGKYLHVEGLSPSAEMIEFCRKLAEENNMEYVYDGNV